MIFLEDASLQPARTLAADQTTHVEICHSQAISYVCGKMERFLPVFQELERVDAPLMIHSLTMDAQVLVLPHAAHTNAIGQHSSATL
jgi:hypothetical protein